MSGLKRTLLIGGAAVVAVLLAAPASQAAFFTYTFSGEVTDVENPNGFFTNSAAVGASVSGSFTYTDNPNAGPSSLGNAAFTNYLHQGTPADTELVLSIGGAVVHSFVSSLTNMIVGDNNPADNFPPFFPIGDSFRYGDTLNDSSALFDFSQAFFSQYATGGLFLVDSTGGVFGSQALPSGLPLSSFDARYGIVDLYDDNLDGTGRITFRIDSIQAVPEPGAYVLLLTGLAAVAVVRLQQTRRRKALSAAGTNRSE